MPPKLVASPIEKGDLIGVKGRIQSLGNNPLQVIAEKVTFLSKQENKIKE